MHPSTSVSMKATSSNRPPSKPAARCRCACVAPSRGNFEHEALVDFEAAPFGTLAAKVDVWRSRGMTNVTGCDEGIKLDMAGRVLDNRVQHVVAAMANLNEAKALATRMNHQYGAKATVRERLVRATVG
jgi:hypothetical protein